MGSRQANWAANWAASCRVPLARATRVCVARTVHGVARREERPSLGAVGEGVDGRHVVVWWGARARRPERELRPISKWTSKWDASRRHSPDGS